MKIIMSLAAIFALGALGLICASFYTGNLKLIPIQLILFGMNVGVFLYAYSA